MSMQARGTFDVHLEPQFQDATEGSTLGRMAIAKRFAGELSATSTGEMLSASNDAGSAVYVAIERVTGTLGGRSGSFVLVHQGTMTPTAQSLTITVAPNSGTDELVGITGGMAITITNGQHFYDFTYTLNSPDEK